jgi:hypothetical protein
MPIVTCRVETSLITSVTVLTNTSLCHIRRTDYSQVGSEGEKQLSSENQEDDIKGCCVTPVIALSYTQPANKCFKTRV